MEPSKLQKAVITAVCQGTSRVAVHAVAGSGKTTLLAQAAEATRLPWTALAFNKDNATAFQKKLPANCNGITTHSLGLSILRQRFGAPASNPFKEQKLYELAKDCGVDKPAGLVSLVKLAYAAGAYRSKPMITPVVTLDQHFVDNAAELHGIKTQDADTVYEVLQESVRLATKEQRYIFEDMLFIPALFSGQSKPIQNLMLDEIQDFSPIQMRLVETVRPNKVLAVGDPNQAIYAWRGADNEAFSAICKKFKLQVMPLNETFRCPHAVVNYVQRWVPEIQAWATNKPGRVIENHTFNIADLRDGDAVICRNNAPLVGLAIDALINYRVVLKIKGKQWAAPVLTIFKELPLTNAKDVLKARWEAAREKAKHKQLIDDRYETVSRILNAGLTYSDLERMFTDDKTDVTLSTGHKCKGFEFERVFWIYPELVGAYGGEQEQNLAYVICTRAINELYICGEPIL